MSIEVLSIEEFAQFVPRSLAKQNGRVFYSGRRAFNRQLPLYVLGLNPGGGPEDHPSETVAAHTKLILKSKLDDRSAYRDESWEGHQPGTYGMAPRVLHLLNRLQLNPGEVPSSNLVFVRSRGAVDINAQLHELAEACWPFHENVINRICPKVILCFGSVTGDYLRRKLNANRKIDEFVEQNERRWKSCTFEAASGIRVVIATHPSRVDWKATATDPSELVATAMQTKLNGRETTSPKNPRLPVSSVLRAKKMQKSSASTNSAYVPKGRTNLAGIEHEQVITALEYLQSKGMSNYHLRKLHHAPEQMKKETFNAAIRYLDKKCGMSPGTQNYYDRILFVAKEHADTGADFESLTHAAISRYPYQVIT